MALASSNQQIARYRASLEDSRGLLNVNKNSLIIE